MNKKPIFDQNPLEKSQFLNFFNLLFLQARKEFFLSTISQKTFSWLILRKIKRRKNCQFLTKTTDQPLSREKSWFFNFFHLLFLKSRKTFLSVQDIIKHIFLTSFPKNNNMKKLPIFDLNHGLTPLEKSQFLDIFNFL